MVCQDMQDWLEAEDSRSWDDALCIVYCTQCMLHSMYAVLGVRCTWCILYSVYAVLGVNS